MCPKCDKTDFDTPKQLHVLRHLERDHDEKHVIARQKDFRRQQDKRWAYLTTRIRESWEDMDRKGVKTLYEPIKRELVELENVYDDSDDEEKMEGGKVERDYEEEEKMVRNAADVAAKASGEEP